MLMAAVREVPLYPAAATHASRPLELARAVVDVGSVLREGGARGARGATKTVPDAKAEYTLRRFRLTQRQRLTTESLPQATARPGEGNVETLPRQRLGQVCLALSACQVRRFRVCCARTGRDAMIHRLSALPFGRLPARWISRHPKQASQACT